MKRLIYILAAAALVCACQQRFEREWELATDVSSIVVSGVNDRACFNIYCTDSWTAEVTKGSEWLSIKETSGNDVTTVHLICTVNEGLSRSGELTIKGSGKTIVIPVVQKAGLGDPKVHFTPGSISYPAGSYRTAIKLLTNIPGRFFNDMTRELKYVSGGEDWISGLTLDETETPAPTEDMPDGIERTVYVTLAGNKTGAERSANLSITMADATGEEIGGSVEIVQTNDEPYITLPAKETATKTASTHSFNIKTNLGFVSGDFVSNVEYDTAGTEGYISDIKVNNDQVSFAIAENESGSLRLARLVISYTDLEGTVTSSSMVVEQNLRAESYDDVVIRTKDELLAWNSNYDLWKDTDHITLGADIDISGEEWTPREFAGELDGAGHTISGISLALDAKNVGFFSILKGSLHDITFGTAGNHGSIVFNGATATPYIGIVGSAAAGATISNVSSYVDVKYEGTQENGLGLGGIVGYYESANTLSGCKFYGKASIETGLKKSSAHNMGGIVGNVGVAATVENCINYGSVYSAPPTMGGSPNVGGIVGYAAIEGIAVNNCSNEGTVEFAGATALPEGVTSCGGQTSLGGIVGYHNTKPMTISGCVNKGTVRRSATTALNHVYLGGIVGFDNNANVITDCSNEGLVENTGAMGGKQLFIGGIAGGSKAAASTFLGCTNKSTAQLNCSASATYIHIGGIVGESGIAGDVIGTAEKPCNNEGTITNSGKSSNGSTNTVPNIALGGLVGLGISPSITKATNSGAITNTGGLSYDQNIITAGGIAGTLTGAGSIIDCKNSGAITEDGTGHIPVSYAGGILGYTMTAAMTGISGCENSGAISFSGAKRNIVAGGIAGYVTTATPISNCTNTATGTVTANGTTTSLTHIAGIAGYITGAQETWDCSNAADIAVTAKGVYVYCGGIIGRVEVDGSKITNCTNTGDFIQSAANTTDGGIRCGGIAGQVRYVVIDGCTQSGDVKNTSAEVTKTHYLGGFVGLNNSNVATIKNCKLLKGEISTASTATNKLGAFLNTTIATKVTDNGISGNVKVGSTQITSENYNTSSLLNGHSGNPAYSGTYFINE